MSNQYTDTRDTEYMPRSVERPQRVITGVALAGFVFGCLAVAICFVPLAGAPAIVFGILAAGFGAIGRTHGDKMFGTAAIILGVVGLIVSLFITISVLTNLNNMSERFEQFTNLTGATTPKALLVEPVEPVTSAAIKPGPVELGGVFEYFAEGGTEGSYDVVFGGDSVFDDLSGEFGSQTYNEALGRPSKVSMTLTGVDDTHNLECQIMLDGVIVDSQSGEGFVECAASMPA